MKKFFQNRFFYVLTTLALLFTIVPTVLCSMGLSFLFRDAVGFVLTPMQKVFHYATESIDGFAAYFYKFDELVEENAALKEQVAELRAQIYDNAEREAMYTWMSDFLDMKQQHMDFEMLAATVTGRESGNYSRILTLDVGSGAGVELHMPVVTSEGIVGQITEVGLNWSKVTTIVEASSSVGAYVERSDDAGICVGDFVLSADGLCRMNYLPAGADVAVGDRILSTGYGSVYPRGLVIGYATAVETDPYTRAPAVTVQCAVDFSDLTRVMVLTGFDITAE